MVAVPHTFGSRQGDIAATELDEDFQALADAINENPSVVNVSPSNTATVNRGIIQAAHDALPASGGILQFTQYGIHIDGQINVTKPVLVLGPGTTEISTPGPFVLYLDTGSQIGWEVTGKGPFLMQNYSMFGAALSTHVHVNGPAGLVNGTEQCRIDNAVFYGGALHLDFEASIWQMVTRSLFYNPTTAGVRAQNLIDADQGDSTIESCIFSEASAAAYGVAYHSGGGLKVKNSKFLGGRFGIAVDPAPGPSDPATISDLQVIGCSIESFAEAGILLARTAGALTPSQFHLCANQIAAPFGGGLYAIRIEPVAGTAYTSILCNDNIITQVPTAYRLRGVSGVSIDGNLFRIAGGTVFDVDNAVMNLTIGAGNNYFDYATVMTGTPGARSFIRGGVFTVAELSTLPMSDGSQSFALDAIGPTDVGYTAGMVATAPGSGWAANRVAGDWRV